MARALTGANAEALSTHPQIRPTPLEALAAEEMPEAFHFVRDHFAPPAADDADWFLEIAGAVEHRARLSLSELKQLPTTTMAVTLECAGHRRAEFRPPTPGV